MVPHKPRYRFIYIAGFLLSIHYAFTLYINSSFLGTIFPEHTINNLYIFGSLITLLALIISTRFINKFGNFKLVLTGIILEIAALLTLGFSNDPKLIMAAFIAHAALPSLIFFGMDIFFEGFLVSSSDAEKVRSYYLTFVNTAFVIAPLTVGFLIKDDSYHIVYILSAIFIAMLWFLILDVFRSIKPKKMHEIGFWDSLRKYLQRKHLTNIFFINLILQSFYAIMVIFMAPYLHEVIGLSWSVIGTIYTIMLLPFVLFQAPLGKLFDKYHDEREVLVVGFLIMSVAVMLMAYTQSSSAIVWAILLFASRVGASFIEVAAEASFFKRITEHDAGFISIFRLGAPLSYVIAPFFAGIIVPALPVTALFAVTSLITLIGVGIAYELKG